MWHWPNRMMTWLILLSGTGSLCLPGAETAPFKIATGIAGHPWGASLNEVLADGRPSIGYIHVDQRTILIVYGGDTALCFEDDRLIGADFGHLFTPRLMHEARSGVAQKEEDTFVTEDGIHADMLYNQIRDLVGGTNLKEEHDFRPTFFLGRAKCDLNFTGCESEFRLYSMRVRVAPLPAPLEKQDMSKNNQF